MQNFTKPPGICPVRSSCRLLIYCICLLSAAPCFAQQKADTLSLAGAWRFSMDTADLGIRHAFYNRSLTGRIHLPGSMVQHNKGFDITLNTRWTASIYDSSWYFDPAMAKYRQPGNLKFPFFLTPLKRYVDPAWYQRTVIIPAGWKHRHIELFLERVHWESRVWVDGQAMGMQNSLSTAQRYDLTTAMTPGTHILTIRIDNRIREINPGRDSHSITDQTQGNWNGIAGKILLTAAPLCRVSRIETFPDPDHHQVKVKLYIAHEQERETKGRIILSASVFNIPGRYRVKPLMLDFRCAGPDTVIMVNYPLGKKIFTWNEFHPALYRLAVLLTADAGRDLQSTVFGMRKLGIAGTRFTINDTPVFLRGTVENCDFPITGYPPTGLASWLRIFKIAKSYGLNEMRFHSYCPPEAAFEAADWEGFYLHVEGPSWANHGSSLGDGKPIDRYIYEEACRIDEAYGNHPSFCLMAYGNEPRGAHQVEFLNRFVDYWKTKDPRHLYTGASVGMSWPWANEEQFIVRSGPRGLPWAAGQPGTLFDHRKALEGHDIPYIAHEMGQYCAFPDFREIKEYTGVHKAKNFELFRETLKDHHLGNEAEKFLQSSGELQALCYKGEIEAALRTPGLAGFELLGLNDYSGQGTALVGVLNVFWKNKGYITAEQFRRFCGPVVITARIPRFTYNAGEIFKAMLAVANFSGEALCKSGLTWKITDGHGHIAGRGELPLSMLKVGNDSIPDEITFPLRDFQRAEKLTLTVSLKHHSVSNHWDFWVYPRQVPDTASGKIYFCHRLDTRAKEILNRGGKVFLLCAGNVEEGKEISMHFLPVFWNTSWFRMRPPHTLGIYLDPRHPAFKHFPTEDFSNFQWWSMVNKQQVMWLKEFPPDFRPLVQPIDTWFLNRRLALIFEAKTGGGKIMVCSADLTTDLMNRPAARQLLYSLTKYMESENFNPRYSVPLATIQRLFEKQEFTSVKKHF